MSQLPGERKIKRLKFRTNFIAQPCKINSRQRIQLQIEIMNYGKVISRIVQH
jgi:hypothetical protein